MAEYLAPGVYVEEFDSGVKAMEGVGTSTAGFVGLAVRGPVVGRPVLLTSFADYQRNFGGFLSELAFREYRFLPNCVEQFFTNGGSTCYVMRVAPEDAATAQGAVKGEGEEPCMQVEAMNPGAWANTMQVTLTRAVRAKTQIMSAPGEKQYELKNVSGFRTGDVVAFQAAPAEGEEAPAPVYRRVTAVNGNVVTLNDALEDAVDAGVVPKKILSACGVNLLLSWQGQEEAYTGACLNPEAADYLPAMMEKSTLARVTLHPKEEPGDLLAMLGAQEGAEKLNISLDGGLDGTYEKVTTGTFNGVDAGPGKRTGIEAFLEISDVSIMAVPGVTIPEVQAQLIAHCENLTSRFAVLDAPLSATGVADLNAHKSAYDTTYAALYAPWVKVYDPLLKRPTFIPPSGSVCGIYARTDIQRGVHKAPANEVVQGCTGLSVTYNEAEQGKLNPNGVNLIRALPGQGIRVWGARTCSSDGNWKYVNVRRLFIFLEESIRKNTNWAVFEPNDQGLWSRVKGTISMFLETQRRNGALMGSTPEEAYYVEVGNTTMSQDDILNGRLICVIGVAPVRPAEFVIFRITQKMQDAT